MKSNLLALIFLFIVFTAKSVIAAPDAGSLLKQEKELQQQQNLPRSIPKSLIEDNTQQPEKQNAGETIFIKEFKFEGEIKAFTKEALKKVIQDLYNKELTFADIQSAASRIKNFYNQKGYFLANAEAYFNISARIKHARGLETDYQHLDKVFVQGGDIVKRGMVIGTKGTTGYRNNMYDKRPPGYPHLHFEVWKDGRRIDPMPFMVGCFNPNKQYAELEMVYPGGCSYKK